MTQHQKNDRIDESLYDGTLLPLPPCEEDLQRMQRDLRMLILCPLEKMLLRTERSDSPLIDTHFSPMTGEAFSPDDPLRGSGMVYGWTQGRALESFAVHATWIKQSSALSDSLKDELDTRIRPVLSRACDALETMRRDNAGRLFFMMDRSGRPRRIDHDGRIVDYELPVDAPSNYSELFYCKGLCAASAYLGDQAGVDAARELFARIADDIDADRFKTDQQRLDPKNVAVQKAEGRYPQGPRMIALGALTTFLSCTRDPYYANLAMRWMEYILSHYVQKQDDAPLIAFDMWEFVDQEGKPYYDEQGRLLSDSGHCTEFSGLGLRFLRCAETLDVLDSDAAARMKRIRQELAQVLIRNFENGFSSEGFGICKAFDLLSRKKINSDMPWWSLPETMRACVEVLRCRADAQRDPYTTILAKSFNALATHYVLPNRSLVPVQTLDENGQIADIPPAVPIADPGYHTGMSLIGVLEGLPHGHCD